MAVGVGGFGGPGIAGRRVVWGGIEGEMAGIDEGHFDKG